MVHTSFGLKKALDANIRCMGQSISEIFLGRMCQASPYAHAIYLAEGDLSVDDKIVRAAEVIA